MKRTAKYGVVETKVHVDFSRCFVMKPTIGQEFGKQPIKSNVSYGELIV